jgi:hypothetical protein
LAYQLDEKAMEFLGIKEEGLGDVMGEVVESVGKNDGLNTQGAMFHLPTRPFLPVILALSRR